MQQVSKDSYAFAHYSFPGRWISYFHQIRCILSRQPTSVLEIGVGDRVIGSFITHNTTIQYRSLDFAPDLHPDIIASVTDIPLPDSSVDLVCAFEVLEHLPFDQFERAVSEMARVASNHFVISLPHYGPALKCSIKIPFLPELKLAWKIPLPRTHVFNGQHYWEIGKRHYPPKAIQRILKRYGVLEEKFIPYENQYHHFFVLRKRK